MRYLCFDIGEKRTGVAAGDDETGLAGPVEVIESAGEDALVDLMVGVIEREGVVEVVVGLPLHMDGVEGKRAEAVRRIGEKVRGRLGCVVHYHDERLSSFAADGKMARSSLTRGQKKARRDALAATAILQDFLDERE